MERECSGAFRLENQQHQQHHHHYHHHHITIITIISIIITDIMTRVKYERAMSDLEFAKRRLLEQHEEDLEQTMVLKKQMEKKVRAMMIITMSP